MNKPDTPNRDTLRIAIMGADRFPGKFLIAATGEGNTVLIDNATPAENDIEGCDLLIVNGPTASMPKGRLPFTVMISSCAVYGGETIDADETSPTDTENANAAELLETEHLVQTTTEGNSAILRCAPIIGTGMDNCWRDMVNDIHRGNYIIDLENQAQRSIVHALTVADACMKIKGHPGVYNLSDGNTYAINEIAEALSRRLNHKRIIKLKHRNAKMASIITDLLTLGTAGMQRRLRLDSITQTINSTKIFQEIDLRAFNTLDYLTNHIYGDEDI